MAKKEKKSRDEGESGLPYDSRGMKPIRRTFPVDMSFIDRDGHRVIPSKEQYDAVKRRQRGYQTPSEDNEYRGQGKHYRGKYHVILIFLSLLLSICFLSSNLTGNVIGNITIENATTSNYIGIAFLAIGLIAGYFYIRSPHNY